MIFSLTVLLVLYTATIIGVAVEISFFRYRAEPVRLNFQNQIIEQFDPTLYLFTRHLGLLRISPLMSLADWVERGEKMDFNDLEKLRSR